jgi:hypothetical protein
MCAHSDTRVGGAELGYVLCVSRMAARQGHHWYGLVYGECVSQSITAYMSLVLIFAAFAISSVGVGGTVDMLCYVLHDLHLCLKPCFCSLGTIVSQHVRRSVDDGTRARTRLRPIRVGHVVH